MARGKYAEKSAKRQAELAVTTDLASYQHRVAKLTAENRELRERLAAQERAAKQTERRLRSERDEGVAPQVQALGVSLKSAVEAREKAQRDARKAHSEMQRIAHRVMDHFEQDHGLTRPAALDVIAFYLYGVEGSASVVEQRLAKLSRDGAEDVLEHALKAVRAKEARGSIASRHDASRFIQDAVTS